MLVYDFMQLKSQPFWNFLNSTSLLKSTMTLKTAKCVCVLDGCWIYCNMLEVPTWSSCI